MTPERKDELVELADRIADSILESWWYEIGSWDGLLEDGELSIDELRWIWDNTKVFGSAERRNEIDPRS